MAPAPGWGACGPTVCGIRPPGPCWSPAVGSLNEVGEPLGHANGQVSMTYASFEVPGLRAGSEPVPDPGFLRRGPVRSGSGRGSVHRQPVRLRLRQPDLPDRAGRALLGTAVDL